MKRSGQLSKVAFETLKISDISKQSDLDCDKAKFEFPKKVNFTDDIDH